MSNIWKSAKLDFSLVKPYVKTICFTMVLPVVFAAINRSLLTGISFAMCFIAMTTGYTFSITEKNSMERLYGILPIRKSDMVIGRYIFIIIMGLTALIFSLIAHPVILTILGESISIFDYISAAVIGIFLFALYTVFQLPGYYKFGSIKGRVFMYIPVAGFLITLLLITKIPVGENKKQEKKSTKVKMTSEPAPTPEVVGSNAIEPEKENSKSPEKPAVSKPETTQPVVAKANEQTVAQTSEQPKMETQTSVTDTETKTDNANEVKPAAEQAHDQVAIINFIDVDKNGAQLTSSGPLVGKPGESINDLYSTEIPLKAIKDAGYEIVFNNFDREGVVQRFDNNDLMTQIFTIGVRKKQTKKQKNSNK